jgi:Sec-independent protein translocase protein TatA
MNLIKLAAQIILIYILYRLVVNFILPLFRSISRFKNDLEKMQQGMNQQYRQQQNFSQQQQSNVSVNKENAITSDDGEYIEFEEIKSKS